MESTLNFKGQGLPYAVEDLLDKLVRDAQAKDETIAQLQRQLAALPKPLTLQDIQQGLSANGAAPLNLTGLPGK